MCIDYDCRSPICRPGLRRDRQRLWPRRSSRGLVVSVAILLGLAPAASAMEPVPFELRPEIEALVTADSWAAAVDHLSDEVETARLKAGILCVAWARDMIGQHWRMLDALEGESTWPRERQQLWQQIGWVDEFEDRYLRPRIDVDSQEALLVAWWPDGVGTPAASDEAERVHRFCLGLPGLLGSVDPHSPYAFDRVFH